MAFTLDDLMFIFPYHLWLELSQTDQEQTWNTVTQAAYSNAAARWNAYLNTLCLNTLLTCFQAELDPEALQSESDPSIWEFVNGSALSVGHTRIVCTPDDKSNGSEVVIPAEWIDIPSWAADYYLAVQVNLEAGWLRVSGYATHQHIRTRAEYDATNRTYTLEVENLIPDLNVMWVAQDQCPPQKPEVQPCPNLQPSELEPLLDKLSQPTAYSPRLSPSFSEWAAILASEQHRQDLYHRRTREHESPAIAIIEDHVSL